MRNGFCNMLDWRKMFSLIFSCDHFQGLNLWSSDLNLVQKRTTRWIFPKSQIFRKNVSRFKTRYYKTMRLTQCIVQVRMRFCKKHFLKICYIEVNIEYFAFLSCSNLTFSEIEIITKLLKNFVKESLNFSQTALCEGFLFRKCEILSLLSCIV